MYRHQMPPMLCPRCRHALIEERAGDVVLRACAKCGGLWLDNDASRRVISSFEGASLAVADRAAQRATELVHTGDKEIPCPECGQKLNATFLSAAGVQIDICDHHGTWFDRSELQLVAEAMLLRTDGEIAEHGNPFAMEDAQLRREIAKLKEGTARDRLDLNRDGQVDVKDLGTFVVLLGKALLRGTAWRSPPD